MCLNGGWGDEGCGCFINPVRVFKFLHFKEGGQGMRGLELYIFFVRNTECDSIVFLKTKNIH